MRLTLPVLHLLGAAAGKPGHARWIAGAIALVATLSISLASAGPPNPTESPPPDIFELKLEDLMRLEITSVSKREQSIADAAAAVYVITQDALLQSGATSIAEALRLVPGLAVARIDANKWAISARGFDGRFANKMLVLIDGRSVYSPLFAGVYWDVQDTLLEDIERIEVIRGPGASLWGANAVNGVINIITRSARDTKDGHVSLIAGDEDRLAAGVRQGFALGKAANGRVYVKAFDRDSGERPGGAGKAADGWHAVRGGFRVDGDLTDTDSFTLQGDLYSGRAGQTFSTVSLLPPFRNVFDETIGFSGGNVLGRWTRKPSPRTDATIQVYYDRTDRSEVLEREVRDTYDIDYQQRYTLNEHHELIWGLGYRYTKDQFRGSEVVTLSPSSRGLGIASAFFEDLIQSSGGRFQLTLGTKLEHNDFTGLEIQPTARVLVRLDDRKSLWAAVSRAVRTPARAYTDVAVALRALPTESGLPGVVTLVGDKQLKAEELLAYEAGFRARIGERFSIDAAVFLNDYRGLLTTEPGQPQPVLDAPVPHLVLPVVSSNLATGRAHGLELAWNWNPAPGLTLDGTYTYFALDMEADPTSQDTSVHSAEGDTPRHQMSVRGHLELPHRIGIGASAHWSDERPNQRVDSRLRLDARLSWQVTDRIDLSLVLQNLLDASHREFGPSGIGEQVAEVERSGYVRLGVRF